MYLNYSCLKLSENSLLILFFCYKIGKYSSNNNRIKNLANNNFFAAKSEKYSGNKNRKNLRKPVLLRLPLTL